MGERGEARRRLQVRWDRLTGPQRVAGIDLARGLAVVGMLAAHLYELPALVPTDPATWGGVASGRSSILFATLAGVSIGLVSGGIRPLKGRALTIARARLGVRAALIWLIGIVLIALGVPVYVILPAYGVLFLLALPALRARPTALFIAAGVVAVVMPPVWLWVMQLPFWQTDAGDLVSTVLGLHYPFPVWIAFVLAGLGVARLPFRRLPTAALIAAVGACLALIGYGLGELVAESDASPMLTAVFSPGPHSSGIGEVIGSGGFALAVIGACVLVCATPVKWIALPLRAVGSMPLTAYAAQLVVWWLVAIIVLGDPGDLFGFRALQPFWPLTGAIVVGCTAWALLAGRGPLEWVVDKAVKAGSPSGPRVRADRLDG